jgi:7-cyano-7-deazaguanine synthase
MPNAASPEEAERAAPLAVLASGGVDSAILLAEAVRSHPAVFPLYVRTGLHWERDELAHFKRFLAELRQPALRELTVLEMPVADLYGAHWSMTGERVPGAETPDEAVFLPGRNVLLLSKAIVWCHLNQVPAVALATLKANPFPDATPEFFSAFQAVVNQAVDGHVEIRRPFASLTKTEVLRRGARLPLDLTFSCIAPVHGQHCGRCNKCAERCRAFADAGLRDRTEYAAVAP